MYSRFNFRRRSDPGLRTATPRHSRNPSSKWRKKRRCALPFALRRRESPATSWRLKLPFGGADDVQVERGSARSAAADALLKITFEEGQQSKSTSQSSLSPVPSITIDFRFAQDV